MTAPFSGYTYTDANGHALTLTAGQQSDLEAALTITPDANNANNGSATWSYGVVDSKLDFLAQGETLTLTYTATVTDSQNVTATQPITVTIHGTDDAPTLSSVVAGTLTDTSAPDTFTNLTGQLVGHDPDDGETASLTYAVLDGNSHVVDGGLAGQYGTLTVNTDGSYTYVPNAAAINALPAGNFSDQFNVQTTDVHGATGTATLTVNVTGADDAPVAVDDANSITAGNAPVSGNLLANDTDAEGDTLSVSAVDQATSNSTTITVDGTYGELVVTKATGAYTYTLGVTSAEAAAVAALGQGATQQDQFTYTASDGTLGTNAHLTVDVTGSAPATSGSAAVTLGPADFNFDGSTYATGPVATANIGNGSDGVTLVGSVNWNGEGDAGHVQVILYNGNTSVSGSGLFGEVTANGLDLQILAGGSTILDTGVVLASGEWHNLALTHENGTFTLYVDGAVAYTGDAGANGIPNPSYPNEPEAMFVAGDGGENFNGAVANVSVWNTALTQSQIQGTDFNALTGSESGLVAYYPLNDGSGTTVTDVVNSAGNLQISGNANWTQATGDTALTIAPDGLQHTVFPFVQISDSTTIDHATVTWNVNGSGASIAGEGLDAFANPLGISITADPSTGGYLLSGTASLAAYEDVLSHLTFATSDPASDGTTFTVTITDSNGDSATATSTINVAIPSGWDVWNGSANDQNWNNLSNWSLGHVPGASDYVLINGDGNTIQDDLGASDAGDQSITQLHLMSSGAILEITNSAADTHSFTITGALDANGSRESLSNAGTISVQNQTVSGSSTNITSVALDIQGNVQNTGSITISNIASGSSTSSSVSADFEGSVQNNGTIAVETTGAGSTTADFQSDVNTSNTISVVAGSTSSSFATAEFHAGFVQNTGTISADGTGATLKFDAVTVNQLNADGLPGTIEGTDGSVIVFDGTTVSGGRISGDLSDNLQIQIGDSSFAGGVALTLEDGVTVVDQIMTIGSGDTLQIEHGSIGPGATFDDVSVTSVNNDGTVQVDGVEDVTTLTLTDGTNLTGVALSIGSSGTVDVEAGSQGQGNLDGQSYDALLDNVAVTGGGAIEINVTSDGDAVLTLADGTSMTGGTLHIGDSGEVYVQSGDNGNVTLDHVTVTVDGFGEIDLGSPESSGSTLILDDGTTITGGILSLNDIGDTLEIAFGSNDIGATFDHVQVDNSGTIQVGATTTSSDPTLTLEDGTTIFGYGIGTLAINAGDTLDIEAGAINGRGATLDGITVVNGGQITIGSGATLTLQNNTSVNGSIAFTGTGDTLALDSTTNATNAVVSGFATGNIIDFTDITSAEDPSFGYNNGVLTLTYYAPGDAEHTSPLSESIKLSGGYSQSNFALQGDGHGGTEIVETGLVINQGVQTPSVSDGGNWYATGQFTVSNPGTGDTWSIAGGHNYTASSNYHFGIDEFSVVNTDGGTPTTIFDDSFNGTVPPAGPAIQNASSPSGVSYSDFGSGTYVQGTGEALLEGSNAGYVGSALGSGTNYGKPVFGQFTTLLTGTSYNTTDPTDGLRSGQSFTAGGLFDLTTPPDTVTRYGIRLSDRNSGAANPANDQPGTETIDLGISRSGTQAVAVLTEYNFETGISTVLQSITINNPHSDNEILLSLSNDAANNGVIVASYQLENNGVADGAPVTFGAVGHIFDNENWTRAQFYTVSTATTPVSSTQTDSVLQGTYGQLDLAQDGSWHYVLNPGLPSVKALANGVTAQDNFQVQVTNAAGQQSTQTISVNVTGTNDAPVATAPAQYSVTSGTAISLVNTGLSVSDPDDGGKTETVTLSASEGTISITAGSSGVTGVTGSGTGSVTFSGTIAQINALLNHSTGPDGGSIAYTDNASSPGFSSAATLTLTIDDNGSNGGTALSDSASATINIAPAEGTLNWDREIDPFATAVTANTTQWVIPNADGLTSTVFNAANPATSSFTYDPTTGLPTGGVVGSIQLVDNTTGNNGTGHVLQTITNLNGLQLGDFGNFIAREQAIESKIPWAGLIETGENGPVSFSSGDIRIANSDGTFTDIIGNNFNQSGNSLTGTVTAVELFDSSGNNLLQTVNFTGGTSLSDFASAVFPDNLSRQFYDLMAPANTTVTGSASSVASGAVNYFEIDVTPGNHTYTSPNTGIIGVNFNEATSGVTVNLAAGTASWGGFTDTLTNMSFVFGSKFADTIVGDTHSDYLDGGGASTGHDTLTGGVGTTFVFQQGYGALTITNFDRASGSFNASDNDIIQLNNLGNPQNVSYVADGGNTDTVLDFGNNDVVTLLNVTQAQFESLHGSEFAGGNNGGNNGGGNNSGPVISNAGNTVTYTGSPLFVDQSVAVTDSTGTVTSVNVWISAGFLAGDELTINGNADGQITNADGSIIHYHFDPSANNNNNGIPAGGIFLYGASGTPTTADFQAALQMIQFTPGAGGGDRTVTWAAQDANNSSPTETTTVHIDAPVVTTNNMALAAQTFFGGIGTENATGIAYANGELYVVGDNPQAGSSPSAHSYVDLFSVNGTTPLWTQAWQYGNFNGIAVDSNEVYAVGAISAGDTTILPSDFDNEDKTLLVRFSTNDGTELGFTSHTWNGSSGTTNFFGYKGVESFSDIIATNQGGNTDLYAVGSGQPNSYDGYIIAKYDSSGDLLASATDSSVGVTFSGAAPIPGSSGANDAVYFNGDIWALGYTAWPTDNGLATNLQAVVWEYDANLNLLGRFKDTDAALSGQNASFSGGVVLGNSLYAFGHTSNSGGGQNYLIADYNSDGSIAWSKSFGDGNGDTLNGAVTLNGHLYVVGTETVGGVTEGVLMEINPSSGSVISTTIYDPAQYNTFTSITSDGHYLYVAGVSGSSVSSDQAVLLTYDPGSATPQAVEDTALTLNSLSVSDPAAGSAQIEVTLAAGHGTIALENSSGLSVVDPGTGSVELFGSQAAIDAALAHGVVYDPTLGYVGSDTLSVTANDQGHNASNSAHVSTQDISISIAPAADTISDGGNLLINSPSGDTVVFATGHGTLDLNQPSTFTGVIGGVTGTGNVLDSDVLDMHGFHYGTTTATTLGGFDFTTDTTTLTVYDSNGNLTETFKLAGDYSTSTWAVTDDHNGGVDIVDPPASSGHPLTGMILNTPDPAASEPTVVADGANAELSGPSSETVTFTGATGSLVIDDPVDFTGHIAGFTGTAPDAEHSDTIDLAGIDFNSAQFTESYNATTGSLSVSDGSHSANFSFDNFKATLNFASDGKGGTLITDPPAPAGGTPQNPIGALLHDLDPNGGFVFNPSGPAHQVLQHVFEEISDVAPLKGLGPLTGQLNASSPTSPYMPPIGGVGVDLAAWHDSLKPLLSHTDFHL